MPKRFRLTRRFPVAMTEDGYRRLKKFSREAGLDEGEALSSLSNTSIQSSTKTHLRTDCGFSTPNSTRARNNVAPQRAPLGGGTS